MSLKSLDTSSKDPYLTNRIIACVQRVARTNETLSQTVFADTARRSPAQASALIWPTSLAVETTYAAAITTQQPYPGINEAVITDALILAAVVANWPPDPEETP